VLQKRLQKHETYAPIITAILTNSGDISPSILMMQTAEYRFRNDLSCLGYGFPLVVCLHFLLKLIGNAWPQGLMRTAGIVMLRPFAKRALQMRCAQRYHIIQTLSADRSD